MFCLPGQHSLLRIFTVYKPVKEKYSSVISKIKEDRLELNSKRKLTQSTSLEEQINLATESLHGDDRNVCLNFIPQSF